MPLSREILDFISGHGNIWNLEVNTACENFFDAQHAKGEKTVAEEKIKYTKGLMYGSHDRHRLDIYSPATDPRQNAPLPVVVYFHGGGFRAGDNDITRHMHGNIAKFFACHGMISILATYRLLPEARFPDGMEDISLAMQWIKKNSGEYGGDPRSVFLIGQSAGGAHLAMAIWSRLLRQDETDEGSTRLPRGIILQSVPFWYDLSQQRRRANMRQYYDSESDEEILSRSAGAIFRDTAAAQRGPSAIFDVPVYITVGQFDPEEIVKGNLMLLQNSMHLARRLPLFQVLEGHNHISYALSIGLEGDEVGPQILQFIRTVLGK